MHLTYALKHKINFIRQLGLCVYGMAVGAVGALKILRPVLRFTGELGALLRSAARCKKLWEVGFERYLDVNNGCGVDCAYGSQSAKRAYGVLGQLFASANVRIGFVRRILFVDGRIQRGGAVSSCAKPVAHIKQSKQIAVRQVAANRGGLRIA